MSSSSPTAEISAQKAPKFRPPRRKRKPISCTPCRESKLRCDRQQPCATCRRRNLVSSCIYPGAALKGSIVSSTQTDTRSLLPSTVSPALSTGHVLLSPRREHETQEDRAASEGHARWDEVFERPTTELCPPPANQGEPAVAQLEGSHFPFSIGPPVAKGDILAQLPPQECCDYLISQYFLRLSPLFHVLHGPTFQRQYNQFLDNPLEANLSWLALLFTILSMILNTMEDDDIILSELWAREFRHKGLRAVASHFRKLAMLCLSQDQFLIRHSLNTLETLLILIYGISHNDGVEQTWVLLGMALNIGIALRCNIKEKPSNMGWIEFERRRRCWAGILLLHTYQAILFRDVDVSSLLEKERTIPADVNDSDIQDDGIHQPSSQPTQMSVIMFKLRLFELSSRICHHLSSDTRLDDHTLASFDSEIASEQAQWDAKFLIDGKPSVLDIASYAHWCILQQYAHQLYLLIHRAFCRPRSAGHCRLDSQLKCISSGAALLEIHRQFYEIPRLRHYRWYVYGMTSFCALHGAVALASCLLMQPGDFDSSSYRAAFDSAVLRIEALRARSPICVKAYPILRHLQTMLSPERFQWSNTSGLEFNNVFDEWIDNVPWLNADSVNWDIWQDILDEPSH